MIRAIIFAVMVLAAPLASARADPAAQARLAAAELAEASAQLDAAENARDRVKALTQTIQAFEHGLAAMRGSLREVSILETQVSARLAAQESEISDLLVVLQSMGGTPSPVTLLHPAGPTGTARAGMLLAELTPALTARATQLRRNLEDVQMLRALQVDAESRLRSGLQDVQEARTALNQAVANRTDLPRRFNTDPVRTAILIASSETLDGFASGLSHIALNDTGARRSSLKDRIGSLELPVQGLILRKAGEADAAGVARPGVIVATRPRAIVTNPAAATIRYTGPLLDLGQVIILEPQADTLFILAGLDVVYGEAGEVIDEGTPLGLMGDSGAKSSKELSTDGDDTGVERTETLYIEVRQANIPEDPGLWFRTDKDG